MIYVSYHNIDVAYAFQLSTLLIRYYRNIWLDRFEIDLADDWDATLREARARATGVIVIVSDDYLESAYCRAEFEYFQNRNMAVTAVIPRDFSTDKIADFTFDDWIDFRRWFDDPSDQSVENLLSQIPQSESVPQTGERLDYLRCFIQTTELTLAKLPTSWVSLRNADAHGASGQRPRMVQPALMQDWDFTGIKSGNSLPVDNLLFWSAEEPQFILRGQTGSGKTFFAQLLALSQAHDALRDERVPVPIWLDLAQWDQGHSSLESFMDAQWPLLTYWRHWLESQTVLVVLDNWSDFAGEFPAQVTKVTSWIDASPNHRFIVLSTNAANVEPSLPIMQINNITTQLAQKFAGAFLTLDQRTSFRQILRNNSAVIETNQLDYLSIGTELLSADRALAVNQWQKNPIPALISLRSQQLPATSVGLDINQILSALQRLAWSMMLQDNHRFVVRESAIGGAIDPRVIDRALDLGLLSESGTKLGFHSEMFQWYLASETLKQDGLIKYLTRPEFAAGRGRIARKWDNLARILVSSIAEENRPRLIDQIAEIDPFLAAMCLRRHPELYSAYQGTLITKLVQLCAQNPAAHEAFRGSIADLPEADRTAELLISQLSRFDNQIQLWLWLEVRALPLALPVNFIQTVAEIDRDSPRSASDQLAPYGLPRSVAYLIKLSQHQDGFIRRNAIWMLGEIKYLPTAILLLDYLEDAERDDHDEVVLALMKYAYSELLVRVLRWSQDNPEYRASVIAALAERKRLVTSRLLAFADARRLTLNPEFYDIVVDTDETAIAIGLAQIASQTVELPEAVDTAILSRKNSSDLRARLAAAIKHLPNREGFQQLVEDIRRVLSDPPESTVIAGSNIEALLYGQPLFDGISAQAEAPPASALPAELVRQLRDDDWQKRHLAVNQLVNYPASAALPLLLEAADDKHKRVRLAAYEILSQFEDEIAAKKTIIAALSDPDIAIVDAVTELLKSISTVDYDALVDLLDSENPMTVAAAIDILGAARHRPAVPDFKRLLDDERRPPNRGATIGQLSRQALDTFETSIFAGDQSGDVSGATSGAASDRSAPGYSDEEKIKRTLEVLRDDDWGRTQKAAKFLRKFTRHLRGSDNTKIMRLLCDSLNDDNWSVRWASAEALAMLRNPAAIPELSGLLNDQSWIVQVAVIRSLVELGAIGETPKMTPLLRSRQKAVRESTAEALGEMRDPLAIPVLAETLKDDTDDFVRFAALRAIHEISSLDARPHLELALSDGFVHLRWFAMQQLAPQMDETDLPILRQLLNDDDKPSWEDASLRDLAIMTLQRIDSNECRALLDSFSVAEKRNSA